MLTFTITNEWIDKGRWNAPLVYFSCAFFGKKEENMEVNFNIWKCRILITFACEKKNCIPINSKQCIQNPLLNTLEWVRKVAQTCTSKIRCDFKMSRNLRGIERWNSKSLRKSTGKVQHVLLLSVWQMVMSNVKKPHNSQLFGMVWQPS